MALANVLTATYHINDGLKAKWDKIKDGKLKKMDNDKVYIVDGRERTGKSTFAIQQACYIDPTLVYDISRICFSADEFLEAIKKTDSTDKITKCVVFDEAFRGLSSRGAMSKVNKKIITALMEVGQKNLVIFIVMPSFFMLDLYAAMLRSNALFHIALDKRSKKRAFYIYPYKKKGLLYQNGVRKGWNYDIKTKNKGFFYDNFPKKAEDEVVKAFFAAYLRKKRKSLVESETEGIEEQEDSKHEQQKNLMIYDMYEKEGLSTVKIAKKLTEAGIPISQRTIWNIINKVMLKLGKIDKSLYEKRKKGLKKVENAEKTSNLYVEMK